MDYRQRTLKKETGCTGIGLHSGEKIRMDIRPAPPDTGIQFVRTDIEGHPMIKAHFDNVIDTTLATTIGDNNGCRVSTIEHLMAAFFGVGIDNAVVELDGPEVPIMDGSAAPFVFLIRSTGIKELKTPKRFFVIKRRFEMNDGNRSITIFPSKELKITYKIDFPHPLLKDQDFELCFSGRDFEREICGARTFGFLKDIETLKENGLARGGSLDNAIVLDDFRIMNSDGLRFKDEFVKHKILDFIGDLSILGSPIIGHFMVEKSGHSLNQQILKKLVRDEKYWEEVTFETQEECCNRNVNIPAFGALDPIPA